MLLELLDLFAAANRKKTKENKQTSNAPNFYIRYMRKRKEIKKKWKKKL